MARLIIDNDLISQIGFSRSERRIIKRFWPDDEAFSVVICDDCHSINPAPFAIKDGIWRLITNPSGSGDLCIACYAKRRDAISIDDLLDDFEPDIPQTQMCLWYYGKPYPLREPLNEGELCLTKHLPKIIELHASLKELFQVKSDNGRQITLAAKNKTQRQKEHRQSPCTTPTYTKRNRVRS